MNILMISPLYYPAIGGGETYIRNISEGLARNGHKVTVLTDIHKHIEGATYTLNGVKVIRTKNYLEQIAAPSKSGWKECIDGLLRDFEKVLPEEQKFDLIHSHNQVALLFGAILKERYKCPLIFTMYETEPQKDSFGDEKARFIHSYLPYDKVITISKYFAEQALHYGVPQSKTTLIYPGVDLCTFNPSRTGEKIRKSLNLANDDVLVLLVGRFKARKSILEFIQAIQLASKKNKKIKALIVGSIDGASPKYLGFVQK